MVAALSLRESAVGPRPCLRGDGAGSEDRGSPVVEGGSQLIKIWLEVSDKEQKRRFAACFDDQLRQWNLSGHDARGHRHLPVLAVVAILTDGQKQFIALECCDGESFEAWKGRRTRLARSAGPALCRA